MIDKAIAKITEEAMAINDPVAFGIEEHLTEICTNDTVARKILAEDKSLKAIYDKVWAEARKRRTGGKNLHDEDTGARMQAALQKVIGGWTP